MKRGSHLAELFRRAASSTRSVGRWCSGLRSSFGPGRRSVTRHAVIGGLILLLPSAHAQATGQIQVRDVAHGQAQFNQNGAHTRVDVSHRAIINYNQFNIPTGHSVQFVQPSADSQVLNRIHSTMPSQIHGTLMANGQVFLVNPAGVVFGAGSVVNVGRLYAAAGDLTDSNFLSGTHRFVSGHGSVINAGFIEGEHGVHLLGRHVQNQGVIYAPRGVVTLSAGSEIYLRENGSSVLVQMDTHKTDADTAQPPAGKPGIANDGLVEGDEVVFSVGDVYSLAMSNRGAIRARGGRVAMEAADGTVSHEGTIDVSSDSGTGGDVHITGGTLKIDGRIDASGASGGGQIRIGGDRGGQGDMPRAERTFIGSKAEVRADALNSGDGGSIVLWGDHLMQMAGSASARGAGDGSGGFIELSSMGRLVLDPLASIQTGGGRILLDPKNTIISLEPPTGDPGDGFDTNPGEDSYLTPDQIIALLNGGHVTIQTNNDLRVEAAIDASGGDGGDLTFWAGRSILIDADIILNGSFEAIANASTSLGVVDAHRDPGPAAFTMAPDTIINTLADPMAGIAIRVADGTGLTHDEGGPITLANLAATGGVLIENLGAGTSAADVVLGGQIIAHTLGSPPDTGDVTIRANRDVDLLEATIDAQLDVRISSHYSGGPDGGSIRLVNSTIISRGDVVLGGGVDPEATPAQGSDRIADGITLSASGIINQHSGDIRLTGTGHGMGRGVSIAVGQVSTETGNLYIHGQGQDTGVAINAAAVGVMDGNVTIQGYSLESTDAAIALSGGAFVGSGGDLRIRAVSTGHDALVLQESVVSGEHIRIEADRMVFDANSAVTGDEVDLRTTTPHEVLGVGDSTLAPSLISGQSLSRITSTMPVDIRNTIGGIELGGAAITGDVAISALPGSILVSGEFSATGQMVLISGSPGNAIGGPGRLIADTLILNTLTGSIGQSQPVPLQVSARDILAMTFAPGALVSLANDYGGAGQAMFRASTVSSNIFLTHQGGPLSVGNVSTGGNQVHITNLDGTGISLDGIVSTQPGGGGLVKLSDLVVNVAPAPGSGNITVINAFNGVAEDLIINVDLIGAARLDLEASRDIIVNGSWRTEGTGQWINASAGRDIFIMPPIGDAASTYLTTGQNADISIWSGRDIIITGRVHAQQSAVYLQADGNGNGIGGVMIDNGQVLAGTNVDIAASVLSARLGGDQAGLVVQGESTPATARIFAAQDIHFEHNEWAPQGAGVLLTGSLPFYDIFTDGGGITIRSNDRIVVDGISLTTNGGDLSLNSDRNGNESGPIHLANSTIESLGGDITISGGPDPELGFAARGIRLENTTLDASAVGGLSGGAVRLRGDGLAHDQDTPGVWIGGSSLLSTSGNEIQVIGLGGTGTAGIRIADATIASLGDGSTLWIEGSGVDLGSADPQLPKTILRVHDLTTIHELGDDVFLVGDVRLLIDSDATISQPLMVTGASGASLFVETPGDLTIDESIMVTGVGLQLISGQRFTATANAAISIGMAELGLTADMMTFQPGAVLDGSGPLRIQPLGNSTPIGIGDGAPGVLTLDQAALDLVQSGFESITIGRDGGNHTIHINQVVFNTPTVFVADGPDGAIFVDGELLGMGITSFTFDGSGQTTTLSADIITRGGAIIFNDTVILANDVRLDTTGGGTAPQGGNVVANRPIDGTIDDFQALFVNAGTGGDVSFNAPVGGVTPLRELVIENANNVNMNGTINAGFVRQEAGTGTTTINGAIDAPRGVDLTNQGGIIANAPVTSTDGGVRFNTPGPVVIDRNAPIFAGAGFERVGGGPTTIGSSITTNAGPVLVDGDFILSHDVTIDTTNQWLFNGAQVDLLGALFGTESGLLLTIISGPMHAINLTPEPPPGSPAVTVEFVREPSGQPGPIIVDFAATVQGATDMGEDEEEERLDEDDLRELREMLGLDRTVQLNASMARLLQRRFATFSEDRLAAFQESFIRAYQEAVIADQSPAQFIQGMDPAEELWSDLARVEAILEALDATLVNPADRPGSRRAVIRRLAPDGISPENFDRIMNRFADRAVLIAGAG
ncbi:MAG: filamentous hemagglutinin N-terminal domain-containing protein [Phycisphaeraceae bacterium]|nr:filamentous hemagglutinin N-terminal domain-containing protein [Phycisphaeraceae bacterium]